MQDLSRIAAAAAEAAVEAADGEETDKRAHHLTVSKMENISRAEAAQQVS